MINEMNIWEFINLTRAKEEHIVPLSTTEHKSRHIVHKGFLGLFWANRCPKIKRRYGIIYLRVVQVVTKDRLQTKTRSLISRNTPLTSTVFKVGCFYSQMVFKLINC